VSEVPSPRQRLSSGYSRQQGEACCRVSGIPNHTKPAAVPRATTTSDRHATNGCRTTLCSNRPLSGVSRRKGRVPETREFRAVLKPPQLQDRHSEPCPRCPAPSNDSLPDTQGSRGRYAAECPESQTTQNSQRSREPLQLSGPPRNERLPHNPMQQPSALRCLKAQRPSAGNSRAEIQRGPEATTTPGPL
jgi:hypothetical protein